MPHTAQLPQVLCYVDRTNLSFAAPEMLRDLHFSPSTYGLGAALFFTGYTLLQVCDSCSHPAPLACKVPAVKR